ncbi:tautomerase family protein [Hwanghaeella grinnelliae]
MPFVRISMRAGKDAAYKHAIMDAIYHALRETFDVPEDDRFIVIDEHGADAFSYGKSYMDIQRSDDLVLIQITASNTRPLETKKALFQRICDLLVEGPGLRAEDVFINLVETDRVNWSFGLGGAQYAAAAQNDDDSGPLPKHFRLAR